MKRYSKLLSILLVIVGTISVFYITSFINLKQLPQFDILTIAGDEKEKENLIVNGMIGINAFNDDQFRLEDGQTSYYRYSSLINRGKLFYETKEIVDLQNRYRSFMRGKSSSPVAFYENDEYVVYSDVIYEDFGIGGYQFQVEVLNKETKKTVTSFTHEIPNRHDYWSLGIAQVQLKEDKLRLITINDTTNDDILQEARLYTFDLTEEKLINDELIVELKRDHYESFGNISVLNKEDIDSPRTAFYVERFSPVASDSVWEDYSEKVTEKKVVIANLMEGTTEQIDIMNDIDEIGTPFYFEDELLYFGTTLINKLEITKYNIADKKVNDKMNVEINPVSVERDNINEAQIIDGKLYYIPTNNSEFTTEPSVVIIDLQGMEIVYEGSLHLKNGQISRDTSLYLNSLEVK